MVDWKSRYASLLDQAEKQTTRYKKKQELLSSALISSGQLARGLDQQADQKLLAIQGLLRQEKLKNVDLEAATRALEKQSQKSVSSRQKDLKRIFKAFKKLSSQTRSLSTDVKTVQALKLFEQALAKDTRLFNEIPSVVENLLALHKNAVRQSKKQSGRAIWRQWFSSDESKGENESVAQDHDFQEDNSEGNSEDNSEGTKSVGSSVNLREVLSSSFTKLIQQLGYPEVVAPTEHILNTRFTAQQIPDLVLSVCDLTRETLNRDRREYRSSLDRLSVRLKESKFEVGSCQAIQESCVNSDTTLHESFEEGLASIQAGISSVDDIQELKNIVGENFEKMSEALNNHKSQSEQENMLKALTTMAQHVQHMEDMTTAAAFRVDTRDKDTKIDFATKLPNQTAFRECSTEILEQWRNGQSLLCIAVCKLDLYSILLKQLEPEELNLVLAQLAGIFQSSLKGNNQTFRYGGEKIIVFLPNVEKEEAALLMDSIRQEVINEDFPCNLEEGSISLSIGIANFKGKDTVESAFTRAERACGPASASSKNRTHLSPD